MALRHAAGPTNALVFESGSLHIDFNRRRVTLGDRDIALTPKEFDVLKYLVTNADRVLTHSLILRAVWGPEYGSETQYLRNVIRDLRRKLHDDPAHPAFIVTEPGVGYRFQTE